MKIKAGILLACLIVPMTAFSAEAVSVSHRIIGFQNQNNYTDITIEITINNDSERWLRSVSLVPNGIEFSGQAKYNTIPLPMLPVNGSITVTWTGQSYLDPQYFDENTPLFFTLEAKYRSGDIVRLPIISSNREII